MNLNETLHALDRILHETETDAWIGKFAGQMTGAPDNREQVR